MIAQTNTGALILVVEAVEETRDGIEQLLKAHGYRVDPARDEEDAVTKARRESPKLILMTLAGPLDVVIATGHRIRERAGLSEAVPLVFFCAPSLPEGAELEIGRNTYVTRPDNFDQLRDFLGRLLLDKSTLEP
jgi:DNA-binding response OmpR family regulator